MTEDYVSFETAKRLKEKGFDECCHVKYKYVKEFDRYLQTTEYVDADFEKYYYACPTLQMAMKWLREVHKMNIEIITYWTKDKRVVYGNRIVHNGTVLKEIDTAYNSYEESCGVAIKYCLENLI